MTPDETGNIFTGNTDLSALLKLAGNKQMADNLFGGNDNSGGFVMGALLGRLLFNQNGLDGTHGNFNTSDRAAIDAAVAAALANANQQNNNSMILLKDIQDTGQDIVAAITSGNQDITSAINSTAQTGLIQQLQNQIANLQGQSDIKAAIAASSASIINETHEQTQTVTNQLDAINTNMLLGFNNVTREINNDGEKTRALITANMVTELNNQIADLRTRQAVDASGITVTNNINQNQLQQQQQQQFANISSVLTALAGQINRNQQDVINLGTMVGNSQTAANTNIR